MKKSARRDANTARWP